MYIFLDDIRNPKDVTITDGFPNIPHSKWYIVRNIDEFKKCIDEFLPVIEHIAFDHDLEIQHYPGNDVDDDGKTGYDCARYLVKQCIERKLPLPMFSSHSMNPCGRENIIGYLKSFLRFSI